MPCARAGTGVIGVGARAVSESGAVGDVSRQQLELFSISKLFTCIVDADDDSIYFDSQITPGACAVAGCARLVPAKCTAGVSGP